MRRQPTDRDWKACGMEGQNRPATTTTTPTTTTKHTPAREKTSSSSSKEVRILSERIQEQKIIIEELKTLKNICGAKPKVYSKQPNLLFKSDREKELAQARKTLDSLQAQYDRLEKGEEETS